MKSNLFAIALVAAVTATAVPVFARDAAQQEARQVINLKDGSTLFVFKDGKMAREDKFGRVMLLKSGEVLEATDGRKLTAVGNQSGRLDVLLRDGHQN